jgi:hypothetical protein
MPPENNKTPEETPSTSQFLTLLDWQTEEYEQQEKSSDWYWAIGIIALGFFVLAIILKNILFALLVILAGFSLAMFGAKKPRVVSFAITSRGLKIENKLYPYDELKSFWINYNPPHVKELYFISKKIFVPQISIPIGTADPNEVREHLLKFLEEREIHESFADVIARFFKF